MLHLSVFMSPTGGHVGGWRMPQAVTNAGFEIEPWLELARILERGKFDMMFLADGNGVNGVENPDLLSRNPTLRPVVIEPVSLMAAMSMVTSRIGLVATATTTYDEPYSIARRFASLDRLSKGRSAWNLVTTSVAEDALNFSRDEHVEQKDRFERATEFAEVVRGLWDSWGEDAFIQNKETGRFLDPSKVKLLNHKGKHFQVRGPLNCARSPQGAPVIIVAGGSPEARELAAQHADVIFTITETKAAALSFYDDIKGRLGKYGRAADHLKVFPGAALFVGRTEAEAEAQYRELQDLIPESVGVQLLSKMLSHDLSKYPPDGPLPEITAEVRGIGSFRSVLLEMAKRDNLSIRQVYQRVLPARGHVVFKGTASQIADQMQDWYESKACDGFNLVAPYVPGGLEAVVDLVIPELQRRGLFRKDYEGSTLREHLDVPIPADPFRVHAAAE
ncbi:MAG: LLM class flavin-dependent oxidoreductase [Pseudomonadota bacterium]|jgi:FMN-dependent oxidoreductase (nitrilotriacetate monooxygenase family)